jgi:hypothetical protein
VLNLFAEPAPKVHSDAQKRQHEADHDDDAADEEDHRAEDWHRRSRLRVQVRPVSGACDEDAAEEGDDHSGQDRLEISFKAGFGVTAHVVSELLPGPILAFVRCDVPRARPRP